MNRVYILEMVEETEDEIKVEIHTVYATREKAISIGSNLVTSSENGYIHYYISEHIVFQ